MSDPVTRLNAALEGRYRIEGELGEGGMATVYLADDLKHERKVALKVLKPELAAVVGAERFLAEIKTTANLQHPHILALFDSGEADGFLFYVMPYVEGESLQEKLDREKQLPVDDAVRIAAEVADALDYAHGRGVIHRDIKPANILLQDGRVLVADFGIALAVREAGGARLTETGLSMGTPLYMSPEQATGDRGLDGRSDLYSLACITYEMLAGDPPYTASTGQAILSRILTEDAKPLSEVRPNVPSHVEAAVHSALEKLPADRPQKAASFAEDLRTTREVPRAAAVSKRRPPWMVPAGLTAALLALVGTGWILFGGRIGPSEPPTSVEQSVAVMPFVNVSGDPDNEFFSDGISGELITALAQLPGVRVPGRTSSFAFTGQNITIRQFADTLDVAHVLEGTVRRDGDRAVITATLLDANTDSQLWTNEFDRELTDVFEIQNEIAQAIADQLRVTLAGGAETRLVARATESAEAHEAYLRGRYLWSQRTEVSLGNAIREFERAIRLDPTYAEAHSGLADSYQVLDVYVEAMEDLDYRQNFDQGLEAAQRAVDLDPGLGMARASLGYGLFNIGDWDGAERAYRRAIDLSPGYATAHQWYALLLYSSGRAIDGVMHAERAVGLDPVSPVISRTLGKALWMAGRTEEAIEQFRQTTELDPSSWFEWLELSRVLIEAGQSDDGMVALENALRSSDYDVEAATDAYRAAVRYHETGEEQTFSDFPYNLDGKIWLYSHTGQPDRAVELFEEYVRQGAYGMAAYIHTFYVTDLLREDPRYQALLDEAGITW